MIAAALVLIVEAWIGLCLGVKLTATIMVGAAGDTLADARRGLWIAVALAGVMVGFGHLLAVAR